MPPEAPSETTRPSAALSGIAAALPFFFGGVVPAGVQARDPILRHATLGAGVA